MSDKSHNPRYASLGFRILAVVGVFVLVFSAALVIRQKTNHSTTSYGPEFRAIALLNVINSEISRFEADNGRFPEPVNGLNELVQKPAGIMKWHQYLEKLPSDPWGHPYLYLCPGKHNTNSFDLSSAGADGIPGTKDDIGNWAINPAHK